MPQAVIVGGLDFRISGLIRCAVKAEVVRGKRSGRPAIFSAKPLVDAHELGYITDMIGVRALRS